MSGQALTQAMQPTHVSSMNSGIRGASWLKSRVAGGAGRDDAAGDAGVGRQLGVGDAAPVGGHDRRLKSST